MNISAQQEGNVCFVTILGKLESPLDRAALLALLKPDSPVSPDCDDMIELSFYDADVLPPDIVEAVTARLDSGGGLKIIAYHSLLVHSLARLDISSKLIMHQAPGMASVPCKALALGGSAQSLDKIFQIVEHLPLSDISIFVVQHVQEDQPNLLDQLLKTRTEYTVVMPQHLMPIKGATIYIAPPSYHMKVANGLIYLTRDRKVQFSRPSIDVLFESLAHEYGDRVMVALLCGYGQDGTAGCAVLREKGATVMVEDGDECQPATAMPHSACHAGAFDFVMKASVIASVAASTIAGAEAKPEGVLLELFLDALADHYGFDFRSYQRESLIRRIKSMMTRFGMGSFNAFQLAVLTDTTLFEQLCAELPVGVTAFFRHPAQLRLVRDTVLPYLASFPMIKVWSAGCSSGEEAYSLAILLEESGLLDRSHLFATDINLYQLELAKGGLYPIGVLAGNRDAYLASGGARLFDVHVPSAGRYLKVEEKLRQRILFHRHSLTDEGVFNEFQLIVCRNVMIYFNADLQRQVLQRFASSLHVDGFLVLGPQDGLHHLAREQGFVPLKPGSHVYRIERSPQHVA